MLCQGGLESDPVAGDEVTKVQAASGNGAGRPVSAVWFAGEHASPWPGWMQGAISSGIKAAKEIGG